MPTTATKNPTVSSAPWSAAFICWVVRQAKINYPNVPFPLNKDSQAHTGYAQQIRDNPGQYQTPPQGWQLIPPFTSDGRTVALKKGDIVVRNRDEGKLVFGSEKWQGVKGHADIVITSPTTFDKPAIVGGNGGTSVDKVFKVDDFQLDDRYFLILRPKREDFANYLARLASEEYEKWKTNGWREGGEQGRKKVNQYWLAIELNLIPPLETSINKTSQVIRALPPISSQAVSPFIHGLDSFHPKIQYELTKRRVAAETANSYMPFVKLTSLTSVKSENVQGGGIAYCPSLGPHGQDEIEFGDIYLPQENNKSIIGYAMQEVGSTTSTPPLPPRKVKVVVKDDTNDARNIPMPGITQISAERGTAGPMGVRGGLLKADVKIAAYSVGQVDTLLRYFLRPATRVVLELGRMTSNRNDPEQTGLNPYNWNQPQDTIKTEFQELIKSPAKQKDFIQRYIYNNFGNYEIFIAYVVKFNLKYTKNNIFEISLTLHSVQQFEIPTRHTGVQSTCANPTKPCKVSDVHEYFNESYSWKNNTFSKLIETHLKPNSIWNSQIIPIKNSNPKTKGGQAASTQAGTRENEYFITWRFFVEKLLNDPSLGIASILSDTDNEQLRNLVTLGLLRITSEASDTSEPSDRGLYANQVGYHPNLRSTNPSVMIIHNPIAQAAFDTSTDKEDYSKLLGSIEKEVRKERNEKSFKITDTELYDSLVKASKPFENVIGQQTEAGASLLTRGVWLNTSAIKQAFTSTDTISSAIDTLLSMMNAATEGYWNLQLYSTDVNNPGMHVIDMGLSKPPSIVAQNKNLKLWIDKEELQSDSVLRSLADITIARYSKPDVEQAKYIYMFNRKTKLLSSGSQYVELGSDLIDLNVEFNLPQVVAVQAIANVGGPAQKSLLQSIKINELKEISLINDLFIECSPQTKEGICSNSEEACINDATQELAERIRQVEAEQILLNSEIEAFQRRTGRTISQVFSSRVEGEAPDDNYIQAEQLLGRKLVLVDRLETAKNERNVTQIQLANPNLVAALRQYADLGTMIQLIELNPSKMIKLLNIDSINDELGRPPAPAHAFNSSNLTKTIIDITLPGIGGIQLFQAFVVDRIPSILERGYYVVTKIIHEFSPQSGWITKIQGRFRFRPDDESAKKNNDEPTLPYNICS